MGLRGSKRFQPILYQAQGPCRGGRSARGRMKGIQTAKMYCRGRPCPRQAKITGVGNWKKGIYNNRDHPKWGRGPEKGERLLGCERSWEFPSSGEAPFLLGTLSRPVLCIFHPQNKPSPYQSPTFGPILYRFIVMGPVRKPRPYKNIIFCDTFCVNLIKFP